MSAFFLYTVSLWNTFFRFCPRYTAGQELLTNEELLSRPYYDYRAIIAASSYSLTAPTTQEKNNKQCTRKLYNNRHSALRRTSHSYEETANDPKNNKSNDTFVNHRRKLNADEADVFVRATQIVM